MSLSGKVGAVFVQTQDAPVSFLNEATTGNDNYTRYNITDAAKRYWDKDSPVTVKVNEEEVVSGYNLEYCGGVMVFEDALEPEDVVTVSGKYLTIEQHGGFFNWSVDLERDTVDITTFQSDGWKENQPTIKGFSAIAEKYWGDEEFFSRLGEEVFVAFYVDSGVSKRRYEGYGIISSDGIETTVDEVINEPIEIQGTKELYYREG